MTKKIYATLITGASKRIGKSISKKLADENKNIIVHYNKSKKEAFELCKELNKNKKIYLYLFQLILISLNK